MGTISGMLALALLGAEPAPTPSPTPSKPIACQARVMTIDALAWRAAFGDHIESVSRNGKTTVWVADRSIQPALVKMGGKQDIALAPVLCMTPDTPASTSMVRTIDYIQHQAVGGNASFFVAEVNHDRLPVPMPEIRVEQGQVEEKFEVGCTAKRLDQGTLVKVRLADSHVAAMHKVPTGESVETFDFNIQSANETDRAWQIEDFSDVIEMAASALESSSYLVRLASMVVGSIEAASNPGVTLGKIEVPEVVAATVEGEWLVPTDSVLIVSFGVHTEADAQGKAVVRDRVAILDFGVKPVPPTQSALPAAMLLPIGNLVRVCEANDPPAVPIAVSHLNMPAVPARSLPEAIDKDGQVIDLPPLPEAYAAADLNQISPGSPLATPQSPLVRAAQPKPMADPELARTSFEPTTNPTAAGPTIGVNFEFDQNGNFTQSITTGPLAAPKPSSLATLVESFLRRGMNFCPGEGCSTPGCPDPASAAEAPDSAEASDCPECPAALSCPANGPTASVRETFSAALQNPGTTETRFLPLSKGLALEVRVRVVPQPQAGNNVDDQTQTGGPQTAQKLLADAKKPRPADKPLDRFWFLDQPSHMTPFRTHGGLGP